MMQLPVTINKFMDNTPTMEVERVSYPAVADHGQATRLGSFLKMLLDYVLVIPGLIFLSPLLLVLALLVKLESPGPIIYRRRVIGRNGIEFDAFKFRTMYINGDEILSQYPHLRAELDKNYKLKCDPRVTRMGQFLRKFSLDELPQLFNIMRQEMSLVGPRIVTKSELAEKYGKHSEKIVTVMPGLTGLWQVSGRSNTSYDERVELDMEYIDTWTIWSDVKIIFRTLPAVAKGEGAY
jgi:lipopolysaccharide/colanic/teichoic acid biosynthesis glycosyltransferase